MQAASARFACIKGNQADNCGKDGDHWPAHWPGSRCGARDASTSQPSQTQQRTPLSALKRTICDFEAAT